jgi:glutathione S-transferase
VKLYMVPLAPNPTKVMLYIAEREAEGVAFGIEQIVVNTVKGRHREPEHLARNPFGTVPTLELDDGRFIVESLPIIEYLEDRWPEGRLNEGTPEARAHARDVERIVDLRLGGPMGQFGHATNSPLGRPADPALAQRCLDAMQVPLDYLERLLDDDRPLLLGERVSVADCTLAASLQFVRFVKADLFGDRPRLRAWDERFRARPAAASVLRW